MMFPLLVRRAATRTPSHFTRWFTSSRNRGIQTVTSSFQEGVPVSAFVENHGDRVVLCNQYYDDLELGAPWLWSNDAKWVHPTSGQRLKTPADYPGSKVRNVRLLSSADGTHSIQEPPPKNSCHSAGGVYASKQQQEDDDIDNLLLEIEWQDEAAELSYYHVNWLLDRALPKQASTEVTSAVALRRNDKLPEVEYGELETDETVLLDLYEALFHRGAVMVRNCPTHHDDDTTPSAAIGRLLAGSLSHGALYGDVFHVQTMSQAHNLAYTSVALPPHQDLAYYESPPGLQLLHCASHENIVGGESLLIDGMAAARHLRDVAPALFDVLARTNATFCKQREGADMVAYWPHIQLSSDDKKEIVGINWSPPFEGPLQCDGGEVSDYYAAYSAFTRLVDRDQPEQHHSLSPQLCKSLNEYAEEFTFEALLEEGDMLVFNNRRMLHGRKPFDMINADEDGARHLVGTYTNMEETLNRYRALMRNHGWRDGMLNAGNGTTV